MFSLHRKLPRVHSILGCSRPRKPRTFGLGLIEAGEPDREARERLERQREASYQLGLMVDALAHGRQDGSNWEEAELCRVNR